MKTVFYQDDRDFYRSMDLKFIMSPHHVRIEIYRNNVYVLLASFTFALEQRSSEWYRAYKRADSLIGHCLAFETDRNASLMRSKNSERRKNDSLFCFITTRIPARLS